MSDQADRQFKISSFPDKVHARVAMGALLCVMAAVLLRTAWIGDDAVITFQQVQRFVAGDGIVWNAGVRVQAFTHPVWFGVLSAALWLTGALFWPAILIGAACTIAAVCLLFRFTAQEAEMPVIGALAFALLVTMSRGFVDYGTSGLENGLSYLMAALVMWRIFRHPPDVWIWLLLALLVLNRQDHAVLFGPLALALLVMSWQQGRMWMVLPGVLLLLGWFGFATFYFGSPLPNTYFAKVATEVELTERLTRGVAYIRDAILRDGFTISIVLLGVIAGIVRGGLARLVSLGLLLHLIYLLSIGGDFMRTRFLAVPFFVSMFLIASILQGTTARRWGVLLFAAVCIVGHPPMTGRDYTNTIIFGDVADERGFYFRATGVMSQERFWPDPHSGDFTTFAPRSVRAGCGAAGSGRYAAPPDIHVIDICGLADPFLARLPIPEGPEWRVGHWVRAVPENYHHVITGREQTLAVGDALYQEIRLITTGPLWQPERLQAILRRLTGSGEKAPESFRRFDDPALIFTNIDGPRPWDVVYAPGRILRGGTPQK